MHGNSPHFPQIRGEGAQISPSGFISGFDFSPSRSLPPPSRSFTKRPALLLNRAAGTLLRLAEALNGVGLEQLQADLRVASPRIERIGF